MSLLTELEQSTEGLRAIRISLRDGNGRFVCQRPETYNETLIPAMALEGRGMVAWGRVERRPRDRRPAESSSPRIGAQDRCPAGIPTPLYRGANRFPGRQPGASASL